MTTTTTEAFEALMPEPTMRLNYAGHFMHRKGPLNIGEHGLYTDDQVRTAMQAVWDAATERAAKQEWLPIATAPRDGTKFLALRRDEIAIAWLLVRDDGDIWNFGRTSACPEVFPSIVPTHWMPLPDAPNAAAIRASSGKGDCDV